MFQMDGCGPLEDEEISEESDTNVTPDKNSDNTGGPSLTRTNEETEEAVLISATVTVGAIEECDKNVHEQVVVALTDSVHVNNSGRKASLLQSVNGF